MLKRVAITGTGCVSPYGVGKHTLAPMFEGIPCNLSKKIITGAQNKEKTFYAGTIPLFEECYAEITPAIVMRTTAMGIYTYMAAKEALQEAGLDEDYTRSGKVGASISSGLGSLHACEFLFTNIWPNSPRSMRSAFPLKTLNYSLAYSLMTAFGLRGKCVSPTAACASGIQSVMSGYDAIRLGQAEVMVCGSAEEYHPFLSVIFDKLNLTATTKGLPFSKNRDGITVGEGAGILILEEYEHALSRGATIYGEILGTGCTMSSDTSHSDADSITQCMELAIQEAENPAIDFVNAHATGTIIGDAEEAKAIRRRLGSGVPVNALKGFLSHTMGASGSVELVAALEGVRKRIIPATGNKEDVADLGINIINNPVSIRQPVTRLLKNSIGLGGVNTSIVLDCYSGESYA